MTLKERFEEKYIPEPNTGCWLWNANAMPSGYGMIWDGGRTKGAHRVSYELYKGEIPEGLHVLHRCDVPGCVNPDHLFLGTHAENMRDRNEKGRAVRGEKHGQAKLTKKDIRDIREDVRSQEVIAVDYGICQAMVSAIKLKKKWAHVE